MYRLQNKIKNVLKTLTKCLKAHVFIAFFKGIWPLILNHVIQYSEKRKTLLVPTHIIYTYEQEMEWMKFSLLAVGKFSVLAHGHGFLLDIVLSEQTRLSSHHLRNGCWDHHVLNGFIALSWLPALRRNHLVKDKYCFP